MATSIDSVLDSRGLSVFLLILAIAVLGFLIANAVYFNRIANDPTTSASNAKAAKNLTWINVVLAIIMGVIVIYYIFKSFTNKQTQSIVYASANAAVESTSKAANEYAQVVSNTLSGPAAAIVPNPNGQGNITIYPVGNGLYTSDAAKGIFFKCNYNDCIEAPPTYAASGAQPLGNGVTATTYTGAPPNVNAYRQFITQGQAQSSNVTFNPVNTQQVPGGYNVGQPVTVSNQPPGVPKSNVNYAPTNPNLPPTNYYVKA
jgi:hypothetical protein